VMMLARLANAPQPQTVPPKMKISAFRQGLRT
jgi:hypothetical protein